MYQIRITELPSKLLRQKSRKIVLPLRPHDELLVKKLIYHIDESQKPNSKFRPGIGVAAIQQGRIKQAFYINTLYLPEENSRLREVLINPVVLFKSKEMIALSTGEGCLSVPPHWPHQQGLVPRHKSITVEAYAYFQKKYVRYEVSGMLAIVFQHELDHLEGRLFIDRINRKDPFNRQNIQELIER